MNKRKNFKRGQHNIGLVKLAIAFTISVVVLLSSKIGLSQQNSDSFSWPDGKKAAISLSFDDARPSQVDNGLSLFDKYGVKVTFYVLPGAVEKRLEKWKAAVASGHEIGGHSLVHPCTGNFLWKRKVALEDYTLSKMEDELNAANDAVYDLLGVRPVAYAYPCGQTFIGRGRATKSYIPLVATIYETGRGWLDERPNDPQFCDLSQLLGMEVDGKSFDEIKKWIDFAKENNLWLILAGHEIGPEGYQTSRITTLEAICQYAIDPKNEVWIDNVHNIASYIKEQRGEKAFVEPPVYKNPVYPVEKRVEDLLSRMTLEEKLGQMNMPCVYIKGLGADIPEKTENCKKLTIGNFKEGIGPAGGFFTLANTILHEGSRQQAEFFNELQKLAVENTRLGIPLLQTEEGTHGLMCTGGTIFPEGLALGSSWNMGLANDIYTIAAKEARALGIHQLYTLVIEPLRDPRIGRNQECYSEDPYFCSRMAEVITMAVQGSDIAAKDKVVAGLCHFPGQSEPVSGMERGAMEISERKLREVFLPSWIAGVKKAGALGVMATYPSVDGIPTHASDFLLTDVLRNELAFKGLVFSEGSGISTIVYENLAKDQKEAGAMALKAGVDVDISLEGAFLQPMVENVEEGKISMDMIDRTVKRILELKFRLGLFEDPYVSPDNAEKIIHTEKSQEVALQAAREGIVLLKNENGILPLQNKPGKIAVIGPNANNKRNQLGDYTAKVISQDIVTVLEGIKQIASPGVQIEYVKGCDVKGNAVNEISKAVKAAKNADVAIVVLGENEWLAPDKTGTNGEGYDLASIELTGLQEELLKKVHETGTPTVLVLVNGRPLAIPWAEKNIPAIVEAWLPGEKGGKAVAEVLFGDYNPNGKLSVTFPRHAGQLPVYYNYMPSKQEWSQNYWGAAYADMPAKPLWEFGHGLSYTNFEYSNLEVSPEKTGPYDKISVKVDVQNTGDREGSEIVQLYVWDAIASVTRPVKELKGFEKVNLKPGEKKTVSFSLNHLSLGHFNRNMEFVVEPGNFEIMIAASSNDIRLKKTIEIIE